MATCSTASTTDDSKSSSTKASEPKADASSALQASKETQQEESSDATKKTATMEKSSSTSSDAQGKRISSDSTSTSEESSAPKRSRPNEDNNKDEQQQQQQQGGEVLDLANTLGIVSGDRLEVKWEISNNDDNNNDETATTTSTTTTHWWAATLLPHDGRVVDESVAVRTLDYDPYPEGGFPERSQEDVVFLGQDVLVDPETHDELLFRRFGDNTAHDEHGDDDDASRVVVAASREQMEQMVNAAMASAMEKQSANWHKLTPAQQRTIASTFAQKKEALLTLLEQQTGVITGAVMQNLLHQAVNGTGTTSSNT